MWKLLSHSHDDMYKPLILFFVHTVHWHAMCTEFHLPHSWATNLNYSTANTSVEHINTQTHIHTHIFSLHASSSPSLFSLTTPWYTYRLARVLKPCNGSSVINTIYPPWEESACSVPDYACINTKYKLVSYNTVQHLHTAALSKSST